MTHIPTHTAIIMDGNGRWAAEKGLPRLAGHKKGAEAVRVAVEGAQKLGISYLTLYAFSSENWDRPVDEVTSLMGLLRLYIKKEIDALDKNGVRVRFIGERKRLDDDIVKLIETAENKTKANSKLTLVIALNYGSRSEITRAVKMIAEKAKEGEVGLNDISEEMVSNYLYTKDIPDPDLVIRTSGEYRLSNFLLWQCAYTEFVFLDILWPDFDFEQFMIALDIFSKRERRYGGREKN